MKALTSVINITFEGNISPLNVSLKNLAELLENIENLFLPIIYQKFPTLKKEEITISLVEIKSGSLQMDLTSTPAEPLNLAYQDFYEISKTNNWYALPPKSLKGLEGITKFANRFQCKTKFISKNGKDLITEIPNDLSFIKEPIQELTTICGKVVRIGGKEKITAQIEVPNEGLISVDLSEELARKLAQRLFEFVELEGELIWDPISEKIIRFKVYNFKPFSPNRAWEVIQELSEEFGKYFDHIEDPVQHIRELRGGE